MSDSEDVIRLALEVKGRQGLDEITAGSARTRAELERLTIAFADEEDAIDAMGEGYAVLARRAGDVSRSVHSVEREIDALVDAAKSGVQAQDRLAEASTRASEAMGRGGAGGKASIGMAALEASRALEDLQYGVGGVVNNIPGLVMALGGGAGAMAAFSLGAVAINQFIKHWDDLMGAMETRNAIPDETEALKAYRAELESVNKRLDDMRTKHSLNNHEMETFNALTAEHARLEAAEAAARKDREAAAQVKATLATPGTEQDQRAKAFQEAVKSVGGEKFEAGLDKALRDEASFKAKELRKLWTDSINEAVRRPGATSESVDAEMLDLDRIYRPAIEGLKSLERHDVEKHSIVQGLMAGDDRARARLRGLAPRAGPAFGAFTPAFEAGQPEAARAKKAEEEAAKKAKEEAEAEQSEYAAIDARTKAARRVYDQKESERAAEYKKNVAKQQADKIRRQKERDRALDPAHWSDFGTNLQARIRAQDYMQRSRGQIAPDAALEMGRRSIEFQKRGLTYQQATQEAVADVIRTLRGMGSKLDQQGRNARELQRAASGLSTNQPTALQAGGPF